MRTVTGTILNAAGRPVHCRVTFASRSTPYFTGDHDLIGNSIVTITTNKTTGGFSVVLEDGNYDVVYYTVPNITKFSIAVQGTTDTVGINELTTTSLVYIGVLPSTLWNERLPLDKTLTLNGEVALSYIDGVPSLQFRYGGANYTITANNNDDRYFNKTGEREPAWFVPVDDPDDDVVGAGDVATGSLNPAENYNYVIAYATEQGVTNYKEITVAAGGKTSIKITLPSTPIEVISIGIWRILTSSAGDFLSNSGYQYLGGFPAAQTSVIDTGSGVPTGGDLGVVVDKPYTNSTAGVIGLITENVRFYNLEVRNSNDFGAGEVAGVIDLGYQNIENLQYMGDGGPIEGTDYSVDYDLGKITILSNFWGDEFTPRPGIAFVFDFSGTKNTGSLQHDPFINLTKGGLVGSSVRLQYDLWLDGHGVTDSVRWFYARGSVVIRFNGASKTLIEAKDNITFSVASVTGIRQPLTARPTEWILHNATIPNVTINLTFPGDWKWLTPKPSKLVYDARAILTVLRVFDSTGTPSYFAAYHAEEVDYIKFRCVDDGLTYKLTIADDGTGTNKVTKVAGPI